MSRDYDELLQCLANTRKIKRDVPNTNDDNAEQHFTHNVNQQNEAVLTAAPIQAPQQITYIPVLPVKHKTNNCYWVPYCKFDASVCNRYCKYMCIYCQQYLHIDPQTHKQD